MPDTIIDGINLTALSLAIAAMQAQIDAYGKELATLQTAPGFDASPLLNRLDALEKGAIEMQDEISAAPPTSDQILAALMQRLGIAAAPAPVQDQPRAAVQGQAGSANNLLPETGQNAALQSSALSQEVSLTPPASAADETQGA